MRRRRFLKGAGVVTILVAGGQIWRVHGQEPPEVGEGPAFEPWRSWGRNAEEGPLALVHSAILSSNAFNSQPWLFKVSSSKIELYADTKRNLGAFDPYLREMFFSLGCALENLCLKAPTAGLEASVSFPPGKLELISDRSRPELAARVNLQPGRRATSELFDAIPHRHTNREPFDTTREVPVEFVDQERKLKMQPETLARLAKITGDASWQPTFMFYMGYAMVPATASARRSMQDVLLREEQASREP